jgi:glycosyltransferase involved in cell wall biosynthesis
MKTFKALIIIPSFNTGPRLLLETVEEAMGAEVDVLVVVDGSTDGSADDLESRVSQPGRLRVHRKPTNSGKGDSLRIGAEEAISDGYTHALVMDSDGQHPAEAIQPMIELARKNPKSIIMGQPVFGDGAPAARVHGRKLTAFWTNIETLWCGLGDTLFGMRVYPLEPLLAAFGQTSFARGFDFDPEIAVRMAWLGCQPIQFQVPVRYLTADEGGVSHFHYLRDNFKLTLLHFRLVPECLLFRLIPFVGNKRKWKNSHL